ncbi:soluble guanylate cyclase 89Da [Trichonephila inaurata madagascariensis]|uniref:Soluble guanylate cyclase 89Da n=1 Tax=Trichonephila inaurata madagascariensis TaxID=2747483 RepID=A0A8X7CIH0_9ARAC|nr:soluble guanylate cyclase 89Da [Trichonephila inaurata madagascariensis]
MKNPRPKKKLERIKAGSSLPLSRSYVHPVNMYGMLLESIQHFVQEEYGEEVWNQVLEDSGFKNAVFTKTNKIRFSYPKMQSPSFYVESEDIGGARLHYRSKRTGFGYYVIGQLIQIAQQFYGLDLQVTLLKDDEDLNGSECHLIYDLR